MDIQKESAAALRKRRNALVRQLPPLKSILRGSLIERYKRCGKPGCKCADGCSVLQLLMLEAEQGSEIELLISGGNEEQCLRNIAAIFNKGSGI